MTRIESVVLGGGWFAVKGIVGGEAARRACDAATAGMVGACVGNAKFEVFARLVFYLSDNVIRTAKETAIAGICRDETGRGIAARSTPFGRKLMFQGDAASVVAEAVDGLVSSETGHRSGG